MIKYPLLVWFWMFQRCSGVTPEALPSRNTPGIRRIIWDIEDQTWISCAIPQASNSHFGDG